jgi:hypothetical protein
MELQKKRGRKKGGLVTISKLSFDEIEELKSLAAKNGFKTKRALARFWKISPVTCGLWFAGDMPAHKIDSLELFRLKEMLKKSLH